MLGLARNGLAVALSLIPLASAGFSPQLAKRTDPPATATSRLVVTGTAGETVTYQAVHNTAYNSISALTTITDSASGAVIVYPGGWVWSPVGSPSVTPAIPADAPVPTTTQPVSASQLLVTASDGAVVTFAPSQDPEYSSVTETKTTTDENHNTIVILPFGWIWAPVGPAPPTVPPIPEDAPLPEVPNNDPNDNPDDPEDDPDDKSCSTTTKPPECTKTISYISQDGGFTSTELGDCGPTTASCMTGKQETTTTTIATELPVATATALDEPDDFVPDTADDAEKDTSQYFLGVFDDEHIGLDEFDVKPVCFKLGWGAPQRDQDGTPSATSKINEWCAAMDGKKVVKQPKGVDTVYQRYGFAYYSFWLSANNWYESSNDCGDEATISKDECVSTLTKAMETCDPNSGDTHGASLTGQCIQYNLTLSASTDDNDPPWNPLPKSAYPQCNEDLSGVMYNWFEKLAPVFCTEVDKDSSKQLTKEYTNADWPTGSTKKRRSFLQPRTPPPSKNSYDGFKFTFDWSGGQGDCRQSCTDAWSSIVNQCGHSGGEGNGMYTQGSKDVGCGTYKYSISVPPKPEPEPEPAPPAVGPDGESQLTNQACRRDQKADSPGFKRDDALKAIDGLCKNKLKSDKNGCIQSTGKGDTPIFVKAAITSQREGSCMAWPFSMVDDEYAYKDSFEEMCKWALTSAVDNCDTDTTDNKKGGTEEANCVVYTIYAYNKGDGLPDSEQCAWARGS